MVYISLKYLHAEHGIQISKGADGLPLAADDSMPPIFAIRRTGGPVEEVVGETLHASRSKLLPSSRGADPVGWLSIKKRRQFGLGTHHTINHHYIIAAAAPHASHPEGATGRNLHWRTSTGRMDALCTPVPARCYSHDHGYGGERGRLQTTVLAEVYVTYIRTIYIYVYK